MKLGMSYVACILIGVLLAGAAGAGSRSVFDDDWVPPKPGETPRPKPVAPVKDPAPAVEPVAPVKEPVVVAPVVRRAVPGKAEQAAVRKVLKEVFADQLVDRSAGGRKKLTESLLAQAAKSTSEPVDEFVLLAAAVDAGTEAANLSLAFAAADRIAAAFEVDGLAVKVETAFKLGTRPEAVELATENVKAGLTLVDQLAEAEDFAAAGRVCSALLPMAGANAALRGELLKRQRDAVAAREASEKVAKHIEKLKTSPDDATANLEVGKYLCFFRGDWKSGLGALSRGSDATLRALAGKELAGASDAEAQAGIGDAWWDLAQGTTGPNKGAIQAHAVEWYKKAAPELKALAKAKVEKRIGDAAKGSGAAVLSGRPADRQEMFAAGNNGCTVMINGREAMKANRDKFSRLAVSLAAGDVIAVRLGDRFNINSFWMTCVSPRGEFLFETSEAWLSYLPADTAKWWDVRAPNVQSKPAEFASNKREYVDQVKQSAEQSGVYRKTQPISSVLTDGTRICHIYHIVTREDLMPKK